MYQVPPGILEICKALGEDTRFSIFSHIASSEKPLTVKDLVALFGMHHSAIRIHLNKLEEAGLIVSRKQHNRGAVGRPQLAFAPNSHPLSISLPLRNYQLLAEVLLQAAGSAQEPGLAEVLGENWGRNYMSRNGQAGDRRLPLAEALPIFLEELRALGDAPQNVETNCESASYFMTNCPFSELADRHELVCAIHRGINKGMLSELVGREIVWQHDGTLAQGRDCCSNQISLGDYSSN